MLTVSPIYVALCALFYLYLVMRVVQRRIQARVTLGDGGDKELRKRIRAHGNFTENAPLLLLMLVAADLQGGPRPLRCTSSAC